MAVSVPPGGHTLQRGRAINIYEYPFMAVVRGAQGRLFGGSAITNEWVLTASDCSIRGPRGVTVWLGMFSIAEMNQAPSRESYMVRNASAVRFHTNCTGTLTLIKVAPSFIPTQRAHFIELAEVEDRFQVGDPYNIVGFNPVARKGLLSHHPVTPLPTFDNGKCGIYNLTGRRCFEGVSNTVKGKLVKNCLDWVGSGVVSPPGNDSNPMAIMGVLLAVQCDSSSDQSFYTVEPLVLYLDWIRSVVKKIPDLAIQYDISQTQELLDELPKDNDNPDNDEAAIQQTIEATTQQTIEIITATEAL